MLPNVKKKKKGKGKSRPLFTRSASSLASVIHKFVSKVCRAGGWGPRPGWGGESETAHRVEFKTSS